MCRPPSPRWGEAFPPGYRDQYDAAEALIDLAEVEALEDSGAPCGCAPSAARATAAATFRFKLYRPTGPRPWPTSCRSSSAWAEGPDRGRLQALAERRQRRPRGLGPRVRPRGRARREPDLRRGAQAFEEAFVAVWTGQVENDGFNRLVLELGLPPRDAALVRALAGYRRQSGLDPSREVQEQALSAYPGVARLILDLFRIKFDPAIAAPPEPLAQAKAVEAKIAEALQAWRASTPTAPCAASPPWSGRSKRTNFYQPGRGRRPKPTSASRSPRASWSTCRPPSPTARSMSPPAHRGRAHPLRPGGPRRPALERPPRRLPHRGAEPGEGPAGQERGDRAGRFAKGCFYPKQMPPGAAPDVARAEAVRAYKTFLSGLLDITDNLDADGKPVRPPAVIVHDDDDPYLVVAADKGTATFSDIANGVAEDYGFWLGDAFASGGSAGYDHKGMGITARGAWEAVKRHFRELGKDIQTEPFTAVGVGDMSGDVFGNGMLLSKQTKLVAAFDHRHIFIDPIPTRRVAEGAGAPVRPAALVVGRLRQEPDLGRAAASIRAA
jgi:glutamate dehydrogenase